MSAGEKDAYLDCSFVSIHYIICECGETFPSESGLRAHLEKEHPHKRERKEFKCGVCGSIFDSEDDCVTHYEENHIIDIKQEDDEDGDEEDEEGDDEDMEVSEQNLLEDEHIVTEQELLEEMPAEEIIDEHLVMTEETIEELTLPAPEPKPQIKVKRELQKSVKPVETAPKKDKLVVKSVKPDRIVMKPQQVLVRSQDGDAEQQVLHIPAEYGQLLQVTPEGQVVIIMNNSAEQEAEDTEQVQEKGKAKRGRPKKSPKQIVCEVCGKKYASNAALKYHQRVHTGEKPYACHLCPKSFAMPLFLQIHIRTHTGEKPYECPECPKAFSNKAALMRHDRVHTGEKPYECPMCLKSFTQSNSLKLHVATVHLKQPAPYKSSNRKLKQAKQRAMKMAEEEETPVKQKKHSQKVAQQHNEDGEAARNIAVQTSEGNMYEVIESEEVNLNEDKEVYTIVYED